MLILKMEESFPSDTLPLFIQLEIQSQRIEFTDEYYTNQTEPI